MYPPFPPDEGPRAPERNPPIHPEYFLPRVFYITAISLSATATITTSLPHDYVIGQTVRLIIPPTYGANQLNEVQGVVISIPAPNQVVTTINSMGSDPFIPTPVYGPTKPQIIAIGDIRNGAINRHVYERTPLTTAVPKTSTFIPGSFRNISPCEGPLP
jgi:hypothetical protein